MNAPLPPRVVVAVSPEVRPRIRAVLPACELRFVETGAELLGVLGDERCDMLIIGVHFEESTAVAALERALRGGELCPVVFVRGRRTLYGERSLHALRMALDELGAENFIDLLRYPDDALGNARVQAMLERLIDRVQT
jgi:hypothetical protein